MESYTEIELSKWMDELKELRKQLERPMKIEIMHDQEERTLTHIPFIQLRIVRRKPGRDGKMTTCFGVPADETFYSIKLPHKPRRR